MAISIGNVIGPILGGFLLKFGWKIIFYFNVPFGIIGTLWAAIQLREVETLPKHQKFDYSGTLVFTIAMINFYLPYLLDLQSGIIHTSLLSLLLQQFCLSCSFILKIV